MQQDKRIMFTKPFVSVKDRGERAKRCFKALYQVFQLVIKSNHYNEYFIVSEYLGLCGFI
jgi:hypothetical protein